MVRTNGRGHWLHARSSHIEPLKRFLLPREAGCVTVTEALPGSPEKTGRRNGRFTVFARDDRVEATVFHTGGGFVFPVLPEDGAPDPRALSRKLRGVRNRLFCVMGLDRDVCGLQRLLSTTPLDTVNYYLMTRTCATPIDPEPLPEGMTIRRAGIRDAEALYPIQREYEIEEVVLRPESFDPASCMSHLKMSLRKQLVYAVEYDGKMVGKAQTNARGFSWDQIGGVYTERPLRGRGIAGAVMYRLLRDIERDGRHSSLFVKRHNEPALRMYRRLGYSVTDEFTIAYYRGI